MKKLFLFTLVLSVSLFIQSQELPAAYKQFVQDHVLKNSDNEVFLLDSVHLYGLFDEFYPDSLLGVREFYTYTPHGVILADSNLTLFFDTITWIYMSKREYNYDGMNRLDYKTDYMGNGVQNIWVKETEYHHTYIGNTGRKDYTIVWDWDYWGGSWVRHDSIVFTYDQQLQMEFEHEYRWNADSGKYFIKEYRHYVYNAQGLLTSDTLYSDWLSSTLTLNFLRNYEYDVYGWENEYRSYNWGESAGWIPVEKHEYTNMANGYPLTDYRYDWDEGSSQWKLYEYGFYSYDVNLNPMLWRYFELNDSSGMFEKDITAQFFWSLHTVLDITEMQESDLLMAYPNPSEGIITIETGYDMTLKIYGMDGKLYSIVSVAAGSNIIDLGSLNPGLYLIMSDDGRSQQKLLIR